MHALHIFMHLLPCLMLFLSKFCEDGNIARLGALCFFKVPKGSPKKPFKLSNSHRPACAVSVVH